MIDLFVFDKDLEPAGILETFESVRWLIEYNGMGEFEIVASATKGNLYMLKIDNIIWKNNGVEAGIIETIVIKDFKITIRGRLLNKLLEDRIIMKQVNITDIESGVRQAITDNAIDNRPIKYLRVQENTAITDRANSQFTYKTLFEMVNSFKDLGFRIAFGITFKQLNFRLYKGTDRSDSVVFSNDLDNLKDEEITLDYKKYKNYAIVGGRGEGTARKIVVYDGRIDKTEAIKEIFVDAKNIEEKKDLGGGNSVDYTDDEMTEMLKDKGIKALAENIYKESFEAEIVVDGNFIYKKDYFLGDIVSCKNTAYNIQLKVRINAIQEVYSSNEYKVIATIGYNY